MGDHLYNWTDRGDVQGGISLQRVVEGVSDMHRNVEAS